MMSAASGHEPDPTTAHSAGADVSGAPARGDKLDLAGQIELLHAVTRRFGAEDAVDRIRRSRRSQRRDRDAAQQEPAADHPCP